ncbi:hypothetical protein TNCV_1535001 [Trichonephila clavipes]|uniref:Uncharacterized protein n=1 Tax=Trichonephila clavipes TaxID=2585209 RepID=A0A8X6V023_TRICX|nr:hypothetical protein TNCV_1535001 [Trichonephila clavipes]
MIEVPDVILTGIKKLLLQICDIWVTESGTLPCPRRSIGKKSGDLAGQGRVLNIVRVHYFVRVGFVGYRSRASSKHLSSHLPVGSLDSSGGQTGVALYRKLHVWASNLQRNRHQMLLLFSRRDVTALALSYGTFPLRKV